MQTYPTGYAESHRIAEQIFREILPRHGMAVREEQIALCHEILDTLYNKEISLCEAGVGIGKTLAYLVACILWQMHRPSQLKMPVVISTSSVALQDAILNEYLPDLSAIMLAEGIITAPITAVVRKGKERFVCDARLAERQEKAISKGKRQKNSLRMAESILDLDHIPNLTRYDRCRICVPQSCPRDCFLRLDCRYQQYLRDSMKPDSLPFQDFGDSTQCFLLRIRLSCSHPAVKALLADWRIHRTAFENGRITSSDYLEWMLQWPPTLSAPDD